MSSQQEMIIDGTVLNPTTHTSFAKPRLNKSGGKAVSVTAKGSNRWLNISTPLMLTWGVNEFVDDASGRRSYDMSLQFPKEGYETESTTRFLENIKAFEEHLKSSAVKYSKEWMGKSKMSREVIDALFHPMLRYPRNKETGEPDMDRAPTLRVKLNFWDEKFDCEIYDVQQDASGQHKRLFPDTEGSVDGPGPMDLIPKGTNVACILVCGGLWFANGKFGCTWKLVQAIVKPKTSMRGRCMVQLSTQDKEALGAQEDADEDEGGVVVEDSSEEEEEEEAEEPAAPSFTAPEPEAPAPKKKRVVRRKGAGAGRT